MESQAKAESVFLSDEDLVRLTGRERHSSQIKELKRMEIQHWVNALGKPVVAKAFFEKPTGEAPVKPRPQVRLLAGRNQRS